MNDFTLLTLKWFRQNKRDLPWRKTSDPYHIWLSEIILQQTRVDQGLAYYNKFVKNYPTVKDLATADEIDILNDWQGLGYYSRARNLHFSAQYINNELNGHFPTDYHEIRKLKGIGKYTAAAIVSTAFNDPFAAVDGNVYRVLSRVFDIKTPIDSTKGQNEFQSLANELIDRNSPGDYNQGVMELGALICTPQPKCERCPVQHLCVAFERGNIASRPVKSKKTKVRDRYFHYLIYTFEGQTIIEQRKEKGIWQNLYQFPLIEANSSKSEDLDEFVSGQTFESEEIIHILSHQRLHVIFHHFNTHPKSLNNSWEIIKIVNIQEYPLPRVIDKYLEEQSID